MMAQEDGLQQQQLTQAWAATVTALVVLLLCAHWMRPCCK
jgi:hypothetical protein